MATISFRVPNDMDEKLSEEARLEGLSRSGVVREALAEYLRQREKERFTAKLVAEARQAYSNPDLLEEAREIAEEAIESGNEALDRAEGAEPGETRPEGDDQRWWR